jgi:hypothetical protein
MADDPDRKAHEKTGGGIVHPRGMGSLEVIREVTRELRDAGWTVEQTHMAWRELWRGRDADDFAAAHPDVAPVFLDVVKRYGPTGASLLLAVLTVVLTIYFGVRAEDLAQEQAELEREQVRLERRQLDMADREASHPKNTGDLSDRDVERIAKAVAERLAERAEQPPRGR